MGSFRQLWFLRLFGVSPLQLRATDTGLVLQQKKSPNRVISWEWFSSGPVVRSGLLFSGIDFAIEDQKESITWLSNSTSRDLREHIYQRLLDLHGERAKASLSHVASLVKKSGYLRTSQAKAIGHFADSQLGRLILPPSDIEFSQDQIQPFENLQQWAELAPALIEQVRREFLDAELA